MNEWIDALSHLLIYSFINELIKRKDSELWLGFVETKLHTISINPAKTMAKIKLCWEWGLQPSASATYRQTGCGLHQRGWLNDACATQQRRSRHELAWIWTDFLSEQRQVTGLVETAGWVARANSKRQFVQYKTQNKFAIPSIQEASALLHMYACTSIYAFFSESMLAFWQVSWAPCRCMSVR